MAGRPGTEADQLNASFADGDGERGQATDREKPAARGDPGRERTRQRPQHKARRDDQHLDPGDAFDAVRVGQGEEDIANYDREEFVVRDRRYGGSRYSTDDSADDGGPDRDPSGGERTQTFLRVEAVRCEITDVIEQVAACSRGGERDVRDDGETEDDRVANSAGRERAQ